jgi:hypothetical protein
MEIIEPTPINKRIVHSTTSTTTLNEVWETAETCRQDYLNSVSFTDLIQMAKLEPIKPTPAKRGK